MAKARGEDAWSLSTPSFPDPPALPTPDPSWTKLTPAEGLPELRDQARERFFGHWHLPDHVCVITAGAKAGLFAALRAGLASGARVILPSPTWPSYADICEAAYVKPLFCPTSAELELALDMVALERLVSEQSPGAIILANPCNPTGRIIPTNQLDDLVGLCVDHGVLLMLDQSFSNIVFDKSAWKASTTRPTQNIVLFDSFSKNYVLQGARVGAAMVPKRLAERFVALHQTIVSSAPTPGQKLALAAFANDTSPLALDRQRRMARDFIKSMGWEQAPQEGTFYFFPRVANIDVFVEFARTKNVYVLTGDAFGPGCDSHFHLCFGKSEQELAHIFGLLNPDP
ncbi:MAG: pyridoxal phosphate-dependent aminotransferase [Pseudomonadota bacterium]